MKTGKALILLISPVGTPAMQTAEMASRLKDAEPTMVLGPSFSDSKLFPMIPITARRISGAEDPLDGGMYFVYRNVESLIMRQAWEDYTI